MRCVSILTLASTFVVPTSLRRTTLSAKDDKVLGLIERKKIGPLVIGGYFAYFLAAEVATVASACFHFLPPQWEAIDPKTGDFVQLKAPFCREPTVKNIIDTL